MQCTGDVSYLQCTWTKETLICSCDIKLYLANFLPRATLEGPKRGFVVFVLVGTFEKEQNVFADEKYSGTKSFQEQKMFRNKKMFWNIFFSKLVS